MSVNQISQNHLWYNPPQHQQHQSLDSSNSKSLIYPHHFHNFNLNHCKNDDVDEHQVNANIERQPHPKLESLFEKQLTPSDVGKLNRLVIPKQHAERHFPLNTSNGADSSGMLLCFEDEAGKLWRFRYSYWNSSQSYVLTKGWSRYVKEKQLESGDFVVFERHPSDPDRLFIGWRRLHDPANAGVVDASSSAVGGVRVYPAHQQAALAGVNNHSRTASFNGSTSSRTLRLFGVNMEYQFESDQSEPVTPDGSSTSSPNGQQQAGYQHYNQQFHPQAYYGMGNLMVQQDGSHSQHRG